ncbi:MAG: YihY/virulence factor BrkB family protein [Bacilli bacterium]|nr:YihY/virulence factor BrkB family protein [Bacilli bacterium]
MKQVKEVVVKASSLITNSYMRILPGQLAFFCMMSLIPLVALIGAICESFSLSLDSISSILSLLPIDVFDLTSTTISGEGLNLNIIIFFISAFLLASNGTHSVIITADEIYNNHDQGIFARRVKSIFMILIFVCMFFLLIVVAILGDSFFQVLEINAPNKNAVHFLRDSFNFFKIPLSLILIYMNIKMIYKMLPEREIPKKSTHYAALFTTIVWIVGTEIYSIYFTHFAKYNLFYGSISNLIMLMVWIYFLAYVFVLGMGLSANYTISYSDLEK